MRAIIPLFILIIVVSGCITTLSGNLTDSTDTEITIPEEMEIPAAVCKVKGIDNRVIAIYRHGCPACDIAIPILEKLEEELQEDFEFIDLADPAGSARIDELKIIPSYIPTVIIDCKAYIGVKSEEEYRELIEAI